MLKHPCWEGRDQPVSGVPKPPPSASRLLLPVAGESELCAGAFSLPYWRPAKAPHNNEQMLSKMSFSGRQRASPRVLP